MMAVTLGKYIDDVSVTSEYELPKECYVPTKSLVEVSAETLEEVTSEGLTEVAVTPFLHEMAYLQKLHCQ